MSIRAPSRSERSLVFLGTSVVSGTATVEALATGPQTRFGDIARRLGSRPPVSDFEHGLRRFSLLILRTTIALVLFILRRVAGSSSRSVRIVAVRRRPGRRSDTGVSSDDHVGDADGGCAADGRRRRDRQASPGDSEFREHGRPVQRQDRNVDDRTGALGKRHRCGGCAVERSRLLATINSRFETGIRSPLDLALLDGRQRGRRSAIRRSTRFHSTSSVVARPSSSTHPMAAAAW